MSHLHYNINKPAVRSTLVISKFNSKPLEILTLSILLRVTRSEVFCYWKSLERKIPVHTHTTGGYAIIKVICYSDII